MKIHGVVDARVNKFTATALGRRRVANLTLDRLYPGKVLVLILHEAEWTPGAVWTRRREEKSAPPSATWDQTRTVQPVAKHFRTLGCYAYL